jgi:CheY-like chemotaxis protein
MGKPVIVAIDDEAEFIDMIQSYFVPRGYDISVAIRGAKGIEIIKEKKPNVVLMDLKMPGIDGDEVLRLLNSMKPSPRVIFVTAYDDGGKTRARLMKMGAYAYFDKPVASLKELEEAVNKASREN